MKISIITPSYNQGKYIEETIKSVIDQDYDNKEYIIIDGRSTDSSVEIIKKYQDKIDYWISEKDKGQAAAINKGFKRATGDIIGWLNSDDMLTTNSLRIISKIFIENPSVDFIYGNCYTLYENRNMVHHRLPENDYPMRYFYTFPYAQPACFYRRKILDEIGYLDESYHFAMDRDFFIRIALNHKILRINDFLAIFRTYPENKSNTLLHIARKDIKKIASTFFLSFGSNDHIKILKQLDFFIGSEKRYGSKLYKFSESDLTYILSKYIRASFTQLISENRFREAREILDFLKDKNKGIIKFDKAYRIFDLKLKYIPWSVMPLLRRLHLIIKKLIT